jgi:predicted nucleic acid-binding protein
MGVSVSVNVVDASALGALLFGEPQAEEMATRLAGAKLVAPALMPFEVANIALVKSRRDPKRRPALLAGFDLLGEMAIDIVAVDHRNVLILAEETGLTVHDASYLWLAKTLDAELVTLDRALAAAHQP